jgi:hypothetical protein
MTTSAIQLASARERADQLIAKYCLRELYELEEKSSLGVEIYDLLSLKLAQSKIKLRVVNDILGSHTIHDVYRNIEGGISLAIVVPVYNEVERMKKNSADTSTDDFYYSAFSGVSEYGENFIVEKKKQLDWLFEGFNKVSYHVYYCDDGCPNGSGDKVQDFIQSNAIAQHSVLFLDKILAEKGNLPPVLAQFASSSESQKAGAVYMGMLHAVQNGADFVVYTDADLSYDLGQLGNFIYPTVFQNSSCVIANRSHRYSVNQESSSSTVLGSKVVMKSILGSLRKELFHEVLPDDTQAGLKLLHRSIIEKVLNKDSNVEKGFGFDVQLLVECYKGQGKQPKSISVVCLESAVHTTADTESTYINLTKTYLSCYRDIESGTSDLQEDAISFLSWLVQDHHWSLLSTTFESLPESENSVLSKVFTLFYRKKNNTSASIYLTREIMDMLLECKKILSKTS